jgi:hypothetical protein
MRSGRWPGEVPTGADKLEATGSLVNPYAVDTGRIHRKTATDQFRASLQCHLDALIEEEEKLARDDRPVDLGAYLIHDYAASLLREIKAWTELS